MGATGLDTQRVLAAADVVLGSQPPHAASSPWWAPASPSISARCQFLQKGRARRCSGFSSPRSLAADPRAQTPTSPSAASARGAVPNYSLTVNGASLCVCSAPVPTVMVMVMVLQGVCFSNTTVLEPCLLWFRSRNSQPYVHTGQEPQGCGVLPLTSRGVGLGARRVQGCLRARQPQVNSSRMGERN